MIRTITYHLILILALLMAGCTGMRYISSNDPLFVGSETEFIGPKENQKKLNSVVDPLLKPKPNPTFLWMRPDLARYNMLSDSAKTKKFWKNKIAAPVLLSEANPYQVSSAIQNRLFHQGYFHNTVTFDTILVSSRKAKYNYTITLHDPYTLATVAFPKPINDLNKKISETKDESLLKPGDLYSLDVVKSERVRIDKYLKDNGYIYFSPDFLELKADTVTGDHEVRTEVIVKPLTPTESRKPYTIRNVYIYNDIVTGDSMTDTIALDSYYLLSNKATLTLNSMKQGVFLKPGELYSQSGYLHTIRYFNDLPIIRSSNVKFVPSGIADQLDAMVYLSQRKRFAYTAEFNTVFRSTNYFGPGVILSYTDRNIRKGAEVLKINLRGSVEVQIVEGEVNPAYQVGVEATYQLPHFYPKFLFNAARKSVPKTNMSVAYNLFNRLDLYRLNSTVINYGYSWSRTDRMRHTFDLLELSFTRIPEDSKSDEFNDYLEENPGVQRSFDEQFIMGAGYEFTYNPSLISRNDFFFRGGLDFAGTILNTIFTITDAEKDELGRYEFLGVPFSQYARLRMDARYSIKPNPNRSIVARFSAGLGIPFGNSDILPYIKQFYVGGTNSLRSFIARSVGPGSELPPEGYNDLTGDIRLEGNIEYRFTLAGNLKGALFLDAGNIWLYNKDPTRPLGHFAFDTFLDQLAMSYGWGLRWDFDFIVARLDFAYTLRTPYLPEGERWTTGFSFWEPVIGIAIGYPF